MREQGSRHGPERLHARRARYAIGRVGDMAGVYLESTVISYLAARPSRDLIVAAHQRLTKTLMREGAFPAGSDADALHVAIASANGLDYLLTWNMAHIANAELRPKIERACRRNGYEPPVLCTPAELMGE